MGEQLNSFESICKTLNDTKKLAEKFANLVSQKGAFVSLYGEIGAGKTAFVKFVADALGVQERVTSPSFVILNEYHSAKIPIYHFDLYRLENEGIKTILDELREYSEGKMLTFVEWAEFSEGNLSEERIDIIFLYDEDLSDKRIVNIYSYGAKQNIIIERLNLQIANCML